MTPANAEAAYRYTDLDDRTVFEVIRKPRPDGGKTFTQRRPVDDEDGGGTHYVYNLDGIEQVPYRWLWLDDALEAEAPATIWVVEGEKDADRLASLGLVATTTAKGAAVVWPLDWGKWFHGAERVYVLPDNDDPGRKAAQQRAEVIATVVPDVRIVELPDVADKGDVSDWLDDGGDLDALYRLGEAAPKVVALQPDADPSPVGALSLRFVADALADPPDEPPELIAGLLRAGELTAIVAPRAVGKSFLVFNLADDLARGEGLFLGKLPIRLKARTLICQGELDAWGSFTRWRMLAERNGGTPPEGVAETFEPWRLRTSVRRSQGRDADSGELWTQEHHVAELDARLEATIVANGFQVVVIDPWAVYFAGRENNNDEAEAALATFRDVAMRTGTAFVIIHHISKATEVREPEDLWRGASRLADWASTRVTMLPHFKTEREWTKYRPGMKRHEARRYLDVHFLRRGTPTEDFSIKWDAASGWWRHWEPTIVKGSAAAPAQSPTYNADGVADQLRLAGGLWTSKRKAAEYMGVSPAIANAALVRGVAARTIVEHRDGNKFSYTLPEDDNPLNLAGEQEPLPDPPPDAEEF